MGEAEDQFYAERVAKFRGLHTMKEPIGDYYFRFGEVWSGDCGAGDPMAPVAIEYRIHPPPDYETIRYRHGLWSVDLGIRRYVQIPTDLRQPLLREIAEGMAKEAYGPPRKKLSPKEQARFEELAKQPSDDYWRWAGCYLRFGDLRIRLNVLIAAHSDKISEAAEEAEKRVKSWRNPGQLEDDGGAATRLNNFIIETLEKAGIPHALPTLQFAGKTSLSSPPDGPELVHLLPLLGCLDATFPQNPKKLTGADPVAGQIIAVKASLARLKIEIRDGSALDFRLWRSLKIGPEHCYLDFLAAWREQKLHLGSTRSDCLSFAASAIAAIVRTLPSFDALDTWFGSEAKGAARDYLTALGDEAKRLGITSHVGNPDFIRAAIQSFGTVYTRFLKRIFESHGSNESGLHYLLEKWAHLVQTKGNREAKDQLALIGSGDSVCEELWGHFGTAAQTLAAGDPVRLKHKSEQASITQPRAEETPRPDERNGQLAASPIAVAPIPASPSALPNGTPAAQAETDRNPHVNPAAYIPTERGKRILGVLKGRALTAEEIEAETGILRRDLYDRRGKPGALQELRDRDLVRHLRRLGFYRPDAPPSELTVRTHHGTQ